MSKLLDFYERVLETSGVHVSEGYIRVLDDVKNVTHNGLPLVLPTKLHIKTMLEVDSTGTPIKVKQLYNPLDETVIRGDSPSMTLSRKLMSVNLGYNSFVLGSLLLKVASDASYQTSTGMLINSFLGAISNVKMPNVTKVVDGKTIDNWIKLHNKAGNDGKNPLITIFAKKGGKINGRKYNRTATFKIKLYEELMKCGTDGVLHGVKLRKKDIAIFKLLYEFLFEGMDANANIIVGSDDTETPGFIALYSIYLPVIKKLTKLAGGIDGVDPELEDVLSLMCTVEVGELQTLSKYKAELCAIPREGDTMRASVNAKKAVPEMGVAAPATETNTSSSAIKAALYGGLSGVSAPANRPAVNAMVQSQPMPQQPMPQQPIYQQPQPMPQQPIYQQPQPMPQQPIYQPPQPMPQQPIYTQPQPMPQQPMMPPMGQPMVSGYQQPAVSIGSHATVGAYGN